MGVPKFFRWISERYPCLSELIKEYQIPEFDHLYLDMNGIIHNCSHPNDYDPHFRITEEKIFKDIFHYIEILFSMIQPKKLFFMAVDGVAPRAKQNQQRGRRFRTAKDAEVLEMKAREKGEALPDAARFDSNCITPGTPFMVRLQEQLKFFVSNKMSTDDLWQGCKIILSGHETPGEGEHKIMDYIRYMKSQPGYDCNTRHCLYGLDADLIMLGLCTHEPHFSLLREEVRFDRKKTDRITTPDETTFFLLHLSLMREYLEHEFSPVISKLPEGLTYDIESIIDDWVLMGFLVGNDFIPPLPEMHINTGALPILYKTYMNVLPKLGGYINEKGTLNLKRFQMYMEELGKFDKEQFDEKFADLQYFQAKTGRRPGGNERKNYNRKKMTPFEMEEMLNFESPKRKSPLVEGVLDPFEDVKPINRDLEALINSTNDLLLSSSSNDEDEWQDIDDTDEADSPDGLKVAEFRHHKRDYYINKLEYEQVTPEVLRSQAEGYVRAIQWNLNYYYNGVCSWSWFYPHHYAPFISDIRDFADMKLDYDMGTPFMPFQQLAAVLPAASKQHLPEAYQWLMVDSNSPIIHYYPKDFETDLNGKKQEWEAVVLIPFIEESVLLAAMEQCADRLNPEEVSRNHHGPMSVFTYSPEDLGIYEAPEYFPTIVHNHAKHDLINREDIFVEPSKLIKGLCPDTRLDVYFPGFPTLKHIEHKGTLAKNKVKVFEQPSRGENMILTIISEKEQDLKQLATDLLGESIYVAWPHLTEAMVVSVSTKEHRYELQDDQPTMFPMLPSDASMWMYSQKAIKEEYMSRRGVQVGDVKILVKALTMMGRKYTYGTKLAPKITLEKQWAKIPSTYAIQATVKDITVHDPTFLQYKTLEEIFPQGTECFILASKLYGHMGEVVEGGKTGRVKVKIVKTEEPDLKAAQALMLNTRTTYMQGVAAGAKLGIGSHLLSRITGNIFVLLSSTNSSNSSNSYKTNIGLNLKYTKKNEEIPGYTRRDPNGASWLYSRKAVDLVNSYMEAFPDLFDYLSSHVGNDDFTEEELFPNMPDRISTIAAWLKEQEYVKIERQTCGSNVLDKEVVLAIEAALDVNVKKEQRCLVQLKPHLLFKPNLHSGNMAPDPTTVYTLFDRVVNIRKGSSVPLGLKGIIIGIHKADKEEEVLYDVVFEAAFTGGLSTNCSANRGYRMARNSLVNITYGIRLDTGISAPSEASWFGSAFAPIDRSRPQVPQNRVFDNAGLNGPPSFKPQPQSWRVKQQSPAEPVTNYTLLTKDKPVDNFETMWRQLSTPADVKPQAMPTQGKSIPPLMSVPSIQSLLPRSQIQPLLAPQYLQARQAKGQDVETNVLKKMLGVGMTETKKMSKPKASNPNNTMTQSVQDIFMAARDQKATSPNLNYCVRLLNAFQANQMGLPRYNYINDNDRGMVRATVQLPDGQNFTGSICQTREQAAESAAQLAYNHLSGLMNPLPPTPPQQWCQPPSYQNYVMPMQQQQQQQQQLGSNSFWTFNNQPPQRYKSPTRKGTKQKQQAPQNMIRVTGAPPAPRERSITPKQDHEEITSRHQEPTGISKTVDATKRSKRPQRIAANFKFAKKHPK